MTPRLHSVSRLLSVVLFASVSSTFAAPPAKPAATPAKPTIAPVKPAATPAPVAATPAVNSGTPEVLYVPGGYQNWKPASAPTLNQVPGSPGLYEGYVYIAGGGQQFFKFTNAPDWDHTNYGDGGGGAFTTDGLAGGLSVPDGGYYELTADLGKNKWTATKTTWSIIGGATEGGWEKDTKMNYDATKDVWTVTTSLKGTGSFKFRANGAWMVDFATDKGGELHYADNPFFGYTASLDDLTAPADGDYVVTLDLHTSGKYTYKLDAK